MAFKIPSTKEFNYKLNQMNKTQFIKRYLNFVREVKISELNKSLNKIYNSNNYDDLNVKFIENNEFNISKNFSMNFNKNTLNVQKLNLVLKNNKSNLRPSIKISTSFHNIASQNIQNKKAA